MNRKFEPTQISEAAQSDISRGLESARKLVERTRSLLLGESRYDEDEEAMGRSVRDTGAKQA